MEPRDPVAIVRNGKWNIPGLYQGEERKKGTGCMEVCKDAGRLAEDATWVICGAAYLLAHSRASCRAQYLVPG